MKSVFTSLFTNQSGACAGGGAKMWRHWYAITIDPYVLDLVRYGVDIEFINIPQQVVPHETHVNRYLAMHLDLEFYNTSR